MAYTDYSISNNMYGYEDEEERRRREQEQLQQQTFGATTTPPVAPVNPETIDYSLAGANTGQPQQSGMGLQLPESVQQQNISMGQPPVQSQPTVVGQQPVIGGQAIMQTVEPDPITPYLNMYQSAQEDPGALLKMSQDDTAPEWMRKRAREQAANLLNGERGLAEAQAMIPKMSPEDLSAALREKTTGGSWLKAIAFSMLGMDQSAAAETAKLGIGKDQAVMGADGVPYMIKVGANGTPIDGYNARTGQKLSAEELVTATAGATTNKGATTHTGKMQDKTTGEIYYERTTPQGIQLVDTNGKRYTGSTANLRAYGIGSDIDTRNQIQINELQNRLAFAGPTASAAEREKVIAENEAKFGPLPESFKAQVRGGQPMPQGTVPTQQAAPQAAPQVMPQQVQPPVANRQPPVANRQPPVAQTQPRVAAPVAPSGGGGTPAQREANLATQQRQSAANIEQQKELNVAELKPPAAQKGANVASDIKNQRFADSTYGLIKPISELIKQSTGSGIGAGVDVVASKFGVGTKGQQAIAQLKPLIYPILANVPRFEGPQSDYDVQVYQSAAGDFANDKLPVATRMAALQGIVQLLKKYDKEGKNDWTFGEGKESNTTSSGNKFKRVQ